MRMGLHLWLPEEKYHGEQGLEQELATHAARGPTQTGQTNSSLEYEIESGQTDSVIQGNLNVTWDQEESKPVQQNHARRHYSKVDCPQHRLEEQKGEVQGLQVTKNL